VPSVQCLLCHDLIGSEEYDEVPTLHRQGLMMFKHRRCGDARLRAEAS
ncbi:MAG: hypothetical protein JWO56_2540, partial [Acidobacteria bacterium]|nr:hypothetical protein [Acidobacteriota bacterium]